MKIQIKHRFDLSVIFECEAENMKIAVEMAIKAKADLRSADLNSADLRYADLSSADLRSADLRYADLSSADLSSADLRSADLRYADLRYADLRSADLNSADLRYADLSSADLHGEKLHKNPLFIYGLQYDVLITKEQFKIGCEFHKVNEWELFDDRSILEMDGKEALQWWRIYKPILMSLHKEHCK